MEGEFDHLWPVDEGGVCREPEHLAELVLRGWLVEVLGEDDALSAVGPAPLEDELVGVCGDEGGQRSDGGAAPVGGGAVGEEAGPGGQRERGVALLFGEGQRAAEQVSLGGELGDGEHGLDLELRVDRVEEAVAPRVAEHGREGRGGVDAPGEDVAVVEVEALAGDVGAVCVEGDAVGGNAGGFDAAGAPDALDVFEVAALAVAVADDDGDGADRVAWACELGLFEEGVEEVAGVGALRFDEAGDAGLVEAANGADAADPGVGDGVGVAGHGRDGGVHLEGGVAAADGREEVGAGDGDVAGVGKAGLQALTLERREGGEDAAAIEEVELPCDEGLGALADGREQVVGAGGEAVAVVIFEDDGREDRRDGLAGLRGVAPDIEAVAGGLLGAAVCQASALPGRKAFPGLCEGGGHGASAMVDQKEVPRASGCASTPSASRMVRPRSAKVARSPSAMPAVAPASMPSRGTRSRVWSEPR